MSETNPTLIRQATEADIPAIYQIALENKYEESKDQNGFLVSEFTEEYYRNALFSKKKAPFLTRIKRLISKPLSKKQKHPRDEPIAYVAERDGEVAAFIYIYLEAYSRDCFRKQPATKTENRVNKLLSPKTEFLVIKQIAVLEDHKRTKLAQALYQHVINQELAPHVFAAIVEKPINPVSQKFHASLGFTPVTRSMSGDLGDPDLKYNQVWYRPTYPIILSKPDVADTEEELFYRPSYETLEKSVEHSRILYLHEDSLNWTKMNVTISILFALLTANYLLTVNMGSNVGQWALVGLFAMGGLILYMLMGTLKSGLSFMASHKDNLRLAETKMLFYHPEYQGCMRHVPTKAPTIKIMDWMPPLAIFFWVFACGLSLAHTATNVLSFLIAASR